MEPIMVGDKVRVTNMGRRLRVWGACGGKPTVSVYSLGASAGSSVFSLSLI